ncbi:MAG TPA: metallophosphoesterase [Vicinamibacterales bacterium]|nr:metallophosphoesterase [Vicinamibacterales bacterium]
MKISRRTALKTVAAVGVAGLFGEGAHGFYVERHATGVTETELPVVGLPRGLDGLRIGLLTDVHRSRWVSEDDVQTAVRLLMDARPDLIVLGGDYITLQDRQYIGSSSELLGTLAAPQGVFGILGNHDDDRDMPAALAARGVQMLKDARTSLSIKGETIELAGLRFWTRRQTEIETLFRGSTGIKILLAHDPRRLVEAQRLNIPLVLSGHTHGGQVVLPLAGPVAARKFPVVQGMARRGQTTIFVSRGLGTVYVPVRINCPPEVALLTLRAAAA